MKLKRFIQNAALNTFHFPSNRNIVILIADPYHWKLSVITKSGKMFEFPSLIDYISSRSVAMFLLEVTVRKRESPDYSRLKVQKLRDQSEESIRSGYGVGTIFVRRKITYLNLEVYDVSPIAVHGANVLNYLSLKADYLYICTDYLFTFSNIKKSCEKI